MRGPVGVTLQGDGGHDDGRRLGEPDLQGPDPPERPPGRPFSCRARSACRREFRRAAKQGRLPRLRDALVWSLSYYKPLYDPRKEIPAERVGPVLAKSAAVAAARAVRS